MTPNERIEELQEKRNEYILNESVFPDDNPSWGEMHEAQAIALAQWNNTDEGKELIALQHLNGNEQAAELYYALKAMLNAYDIGQRSGSGSALWIARNTTYTLEKED